MDAQTQFNSWALVELFGHQRISGLVTEQQIAGAGFVRVDVPAINGIPGYTKLYYPSAIYGITPCGEQEARRAAEYLHERPIQPYMVAAPPEDGMSSAPRLAGIHRNDEGEFINDEIDDEEDDENGG